jgi:hypothetical protein
MTLHIAKGFDLPDQAVTQTFGILAVRRSGKSNAAVVMAEEMYDAGLPWVAIDPKGDWWGMRSSGDGKKPGLSVLVFGGDHADVPLEPTGGDLVADLIVDQRITCILDTSEMTKADQRRFLLAFATRLYKRNRLPLHVFCEEADEYIPQRVLGEDTKLVRAFEILIKRGGNRGIGSTVITQRSASLNNDVLTQIETLFAMRTLGTPDRKAVKDWATGHSTGVDVIAELPQLQQGEAWVFSPFFLQTVEKIQFRQRRTFDSGATPEVGKEIITPTRRAKVDLDAIKDAMADTIERAQADDPKKLRAQIADLQRQLREPRVRVPDPIRIEVPAVTDEMLAALHVAARDLNKQVTALQEAVARSATAVGEAIAPLVAALQKATPTNKMLQQLAAPPAARPNRAIPPASSPARTAPADVDPDVRLRKGAHRMVEALGRMAPLRLTKAQWGTVAKLKTSGGTWSTYLGDIRRAGLLDGDPVAGYTLTPAGFDYLGGRPTPMTPTELQVYYRSILRAGAAKMLDALIDAHPGSLTREEIGAAADIAITGGTFSTYLGDLTRNGLAERQPDGTVVATNVLIYGANQ